MEINSYSSIVAVGNKACAPLVGAQVIVEEKIDGSQYAVPFTFDEANIDHNASSLAYIRLAFWPLCI